MSLNDQEGIVVSKARLTYIGAVLGILGVGYTVFGDYNRRGFEIERLRERDTARSSEVAKLSAKIDSQSREISKDLTTIKIAIGQISNQLDRDRKDGE